MHNSDQNGEKLYGFAKEVSKATGRSRKVDGYKGNADLFANCSVDGNFCLQWVRAVSMPALS